MGQLTDGLNALIRYSNEVTGASDGTISAAVETLVSGYGQGGGGGLNSFSVMFEDGTTEVMSPISTPFVGASMSVGGRAVRAIIVNGQEAWPKESLPSEYQAVTYIEGTGTQYIELPFGFSATDRIEMLAQMQNTSVDKYLVAPRTWNDSGSNRFAMGGVASGCFGFAFGSRSTSDTRLTISYTAGVHRWGYSNRKFSIDNYEGGGDTSSIPFSGDTTNLRLFFGYDAFTAGRIYYYIHSKGTTTYHLLPCYRKADGVIGMYDVVNRVFYTNNGIGQFNKGADLASFGM